LARTWCPQLVRRTRALATAFLLAFLALLATPLASLAAETRPGEVITVGPNETINDDLYAFGRAVDVLGTVRGDVIAAAAAVTISGTVAGDVMAAGGQVRVTGDVAGSVRAGAGDVAIDGRVGEDVVVGSGNLTVGTRASVGRDVYAGSGSALINGRVGRNVVAGVGEMTIGAPIGGNVETQVGRLRLTEGASVSGQLRYTSDNTAEIAPGVPIQGGVQQRVPERRTETDDPNARAFGIFIAWLRGLVGLFVLGLLLELLAPGISARTLATVSRSPATSILVGLLLVFIIPMAALLVLGIGFLIGGWWIGLMILAAYAIALISSVPLAAIAIGRLLLDRFGRRGVHFGWALLVGVVILTLIGLIPFAGLLLICLAALVAFGGLILSRFRRPAPPATREPVEPVPAPTPVPTAPV